MAFYLQFDGVDDRVTFNSPLDILTRTSYRLEFSIASPAGMANFQTIMVLGNIANDQGSVLLNSGGGSGGIVDVRYTTGASRARWIISNQFTVLFDGNPHDLILQRDGNNHELFIDGVSYGTATSSFVGSSTTTSGISRSGRSAFDFYNIRGFNAPSGGIELFNYNKQTLSGSNDTTLPDTVGGNDGTLVNFPTDNSQWVFFSGGGATYTITLDSGSYSLSGQDVALLSNKLISFESGAYTYDGQDVDLFASRSINLESGNYAYNGQDVNLLANKSISLEPANYTYTGQDITLVYNPSGGPTYLLAIDAGAYNYSGQDTQLIANRTLSIDSGDYAYTGSNLSLRANRSISIDSGAYVVTGDAVVLSANRAITLEAGNYAYTGSPVTLSYSGEVIALVSGYSVNYAQDDATATYIDDYIKARFI